MIKLYGRIQPKRLFGEVKINYGAYNGKLQAKTVAPSQEEQTVFPDSGFKGLSHVIVEAAALQEKTIKPSGIEQTVVPDVGVYGLSKVIVEAQGNHGLLEDKTVSPSEEEQILEPSDGYYGIQSVTVKAAPLEEKTATSTDQDQTLTPSEGYYGMDQIIVKGIPNAEDYTFCEAETFPAIPEDVLALNPYALIAKTMIGGASAYLLGVSASAFFYGKEGDVRGLGTAGSGAIYYVTVGGVAWSLITNFPAGYGKQELTDNDALMWANHDVTDVNEGFTYFAKSDVYPAASAEVYRIQKETADDIGREINRLWKTAEPMTAERMKEKLEDLDIELTELTVYATDEVQEITPDGYYGFSKIIVEAVEDSGGSGEGEGDETTTGRAENTTFGDNYYNAPTGKYDYSAGADEDPYYIPEIPGDNYTILFSKKRKFCNEIRLKFAGDDYLITSSNGNFYACVIWGRNLAAESTGSSLRIYSENSISYKWSTLNTNRGGEGKTAALSGQTGYGATITSNTLMALAYSISASGVSVFDVGDHADGASLSNAMDSVYGSAGGNAGADQFIAFGSNTPIIYDGSVVNNTDKSSMTIYEVNASGTKTTWTPAGYTDGSDYPVSGYTRVWNSHDLLDSTGQNVTYNKSADPVEEMGLSDVGTPVERDEVYSIAGDSMNSIVSAAQKVTGRKDPMTPDEAADALEEFYSQPKAEELTY